MEAKDIVKHSEDITLNRIEGNRFCTIWPGAKEALTLLQSIIKNPIAKGAIGVVIAAGDAVSKQVCPA